MFRLRPRWYSDGPLERRLIHWYSRMQQHRRWKESSAVAGKAKKTVTPASYIAGSKAGKQLAAESQELTDAIRNIGVIAHIDAGKTTTTERLLYYSGLTRHLGDIDDGDTVTDFMAQERERGITITAAAVSYRWKDHRVNLIDTPGHVDFTLEVEKSLRVLDGALVVLDASAGVEAQTLTVWRQANEMETPCVAFVNKMDKNNADLSMSLDSVKQKLGMTPILLQMPLGEKRDFRGIVDLLTMTKLEWRGKNATAGGTSNDGAHYDVSPLSSHADGDLLPHLLRNRRELVEAVADLDDDLADEFLGVEDALQVRPVLLKAALRRLVIRRKALPVMVGSALKNTGIQPLMDGIVDYLPSPSEISRPFLRFHDTASKGSLCALAFKILFDPNKGPLTFVRVYAGELRAGQSIFNVSRGTQEKVVALFTAFADEMTPTPVVTAGNIAVVSGFLLTKSGDALIPSHSHAKLLKKRVMDERKKWRGRADSGARTDDDDESGSQLVSSSMDDLLSPALPSIEIPEPVFFCSIEPPSMGKQKDLEKALERLEREDPSLRVKVDDDTNQTILSGMGELHLEIILDRIRREYKIDAELGSMQVVYKERVNVLPEPVVERFVFDRVMNGRQCQAEVVLELDGDVEDDFKLSTNRFWSSSERPDLPPYLLETWITHVDHGVQAALSSGPLVGSPVCNARVSLLHVFSTKRTPPSAISAAASHCLSRLLKRANVSLLEPVMRVDMSVDPRFFEAVRHDLCVRRGVIEATSFEASMRTIVALVPLAEMLGYSTAVRIMTSGTLTFTARLAEFHEVAADETERIVAQRGGGRELPRGER